MKTISIIAGAAVVAGTAAFFAIPAFTADRNAPASQALHENEHVMPTSIQQVQLTFAPVVKRVVPAVVNVYSTSVQQVQVNPLFSDPFFSQFFGATPEMRKRVQQSLGSGVIVRSDGIIVTNDHVVKGGTDIVVVLSDKREFKAKVLMADPRTDLAVLKIDTKGEKLPVVPFGDSSKLEVGDLVLAVGDPFGVGQTVTMGIISALARTQGSANNYKFFIQTDAAINPGNSGGALVTTDGRLAGLNTAIYSRSGGNIGIGFAIPANLVRRVVESVERGLKTGHPGSVQLAWVGATGQAVTSDIAASLGLSKPGGVLIKDVYPGGPLARAGIGSGDVVESVDGSSVDDMQALNYRTATHRPGDKVVMRVVSNGKARNVAVTLTLPPENPPRDLHTVGGRNPLTGAKVENISPATAIELQIDPLSRGVAVVDVGNSIASNYSFQAGDIIESINGTRVGNVNALLRLLGDANQWQLVILRNGQRLTLSVAR